MAAGDAENPYVQAANDGTEGDSGAFLKQLAAALAAAGAGLGGRALANANSQSSVPPQLLQLLDNSVARQGYQNPLFQATTKGTFDMLPTFAKEGSALSGSLPSTLPPAQPFGGSGSSGPGLKTAAGLGGAAALAAALGKNGSSMDLSKLFNWLRSKFGGQKFGSVDNSGALPNYDPFNSNGNWDGMAPNQGGQPGLSDPNANVNTNEFLGQWPETSTPFAAFDPNQLGGTGQDDNPYGY